MTLMTGEHLNTKKGGEPLSLKVRIYQLKNKEKFEQATFRDLWKHDKEYLGEDLVVRKERTVHPEREEDLDLKVDTDKDVKYFGIVGLFQYYEGDSWKKVVTSDPSSWIGTPTIEVLLDYHAVTLEE